MRIAYNGRYLLNKNMTGVERVGYNLLKALVTHDKRNEYVIFTGARERSDPRKWPENVFFHESRVLNINKACRHGWEQMILPFQVRERHCDFLFNPANTGPVIGGQNSVFFLCDVSFIVNPEWFSRSFRMAYGMLVPMAARKARRIITISQSSKNEIIRCLGIDGSKISVIYPAVDEDFLAMQPASWNTISVKLKIRKPYILFVGSMDPRKNLKRLLSAYNRLKDEIKKEYDLVIAGAANTNFSEAFDKDAVSENVRFVGHIDDAVLKALYSNATLFVYPSLYEGFGLPPLEAMSCGTPVIVSRSTSLPEACGDGAYYIDPADTGSIVAGIEKMLSDAPLRTALKEKGLRQASVFSWERAAKETLNIWDELRDENSYRS